MKLSDWKVRVVVLAVFVLHLSGCVLEKAPVVVNGLKEEVSFEVEFGDGNTISVTLEPGAAGWLAYEDSPVVAFSVRSANGTFDDVEYAALEKWQSSLGEDELLVLAVTSDGVKKANKKQISEYRNREKKD